MNEGSYSWRCIHCGHITFWSAEERRVIYTCTCHTRQFKQPTIPIHDDWVVGDDAIAFSDNNRVEVPQVFYDAFKEKNGEK